MKRITNIKNLKPTDFKNPIITLGVFDGVHLGHQRLLKDVIDWAGTVGGEAVALTFKRHPKTIIQGLPPSFITSLKHRLLLFEKIGIDKTVVLPFDKAFSSLEPEEFVKKILIEMIGTNKVLLGFNSSFGKNAKGNLSLVKEIGKKYLIEVRTTKPVKINDKAISSTDIRNLIIEGDLKPASLMLGRPVSVLGTVIKGSRRGKSLGFPTANLNLHHEIKPPSGVYTGEVVINQETYDALINIGRRPTFEKIKSVIVETHILDFERDIYGKDIEVRFFSKIRNEMKFHTREDLITQLKKDREFLLSKGKPAFC